MRDQQVNTFFNGMQKDLGATLPQEGSYIDGENIRIITGGEKEQSGIVVSVNGNEKILELTRPVYVAPVESTEVIYIDGVYGSNTNEEEYPVRPLGYTYIKNKLIVYGVSACAPINCPVCENCEEDIMSSIHVINLDDYSQETIYKSKDLNFNFDYPIQAVGRYESEAMQRIYWTDNLNPVRTLNIMQDNLQAIPVVELGLNIPINFSSPKINSVNKSGDLPAGMYQYAYRLKTSEGAITRFSPLSNFTHVVAGSKYWDYQEDPENQTEYSNTTPGEFTDKAVVIDVENIDSDYEFIEIAAVYKTASNAIESAYLVEETKIDNYDLMQITHRNDSGASLLIEEVTEITSIPDKAKAMCVKDNRLFLGNLEYTPFELQFNARSYRYRRVDGTRYPRKSIEDTTTYVDEDFDPITQQGSSTFNTQHNLDAINPYNRNSSTQIATSLLYKFKKDGITLGGEGPNVEYEFFKHRLDGNTASGNNYFIPESPPFVSTVFRSESDSGDYKSPENVSQFTGYHRDEIYRFGIVLYDLYGNPGFVNWIGDIKFPSYEDYDHKKSGGIYNYTLGQVLGVTDSGTNYVYNNPDPNEATTVNAYQFIDVTNPNQYYGQQSRYDFDDLDFNMYSGGSLYALGIRFTVNIPNDIKDKISGYRVVRVERKQVDKTILGTGLINFFRNSNYIVTNNNFQSFGVYTDTTGGHPIVPLGHRVKDEDRTLVSLDSPDFAFGEYPTSTSNYLKIIGTVTGRRTDNFETNNRGSATCYSAHVLPLHQNGLFYTEEIEYSTKLGAGDNITIPDYSYTSSFNGTGLFNRCIEQLGDGTTNVVGIGEETLFLKLNSELSRVNFIESGVTEYFGSFDSNSTYSGDTGTYGRAKMLGSIKTERPTQYGGNTELNRTGNKYIPAGPFININEDPVTHNVWGGDTYVVLYDLEKIRRHDADLDSGAGAGDNRKTVNFAFPVESAFNTTLRGGWHFANKSDWATESTTLLNTFNLASCYSSQNNTEIFIPKPLGFVETSAFNSRILYSDAKINGEKIDSWRKYGVENYRDIEGSYGDINKLIVYSDIAYYLQDNAFGSLSISPVSTVVDQDGASIVLGTGDIIQDNKYISTSIGCTNFLSVIDSEKGIYWVDYNKKKAYAFRANGLESISDTHGVKSWFSDNLQEDSCVLGYDYLNSEVLFSVNPGAHTIVFSEALNKFTSTYSFNSSIFMSGVRGLLSVGQANTESTFIYAHNAEESAQWYDYPHYQSKLEFIVNKNPLNSKIYDTLEWYSPEGDLKKIKFSNSYLDTDDAIINAVTSEDDSLQNVYKREQMHRAAVPRDPLGGRLRDTYLKVRMIFETTGTKAVLHYVKTLFRISRR